MSDAPLPILIAFAVLIGWPALQALNLVLLVRPRRANVRRLAHALRCDPAYTDDVSQRAIIQAERDAWGSPVIAFLPIIAPFGVAAMSLAEIFGPKPGATISREENSRLTRDAFFADTKYPSDGPLWEDERFRDLQFAAIDAGFLSWPVSFALTLVGVVVTAPLWIVAYGLRWSTVEGFKRVAEAATRFARTLPTLGPHAR